MSAIYPWFQRAFPGGYPTELYPNLVARIAGTPARVEELVDNLSRAVLTTSLDGSWSIQRHVGHLADLEALWLQRLDDFDAGAPVLTPADLENRRTHDANHDTVEVSAVTGAFRHARAMLVKRASTWNRADMERVARHPRLDRPTRALDLLLFVAEHDDHHLARIAELRSGD